MIVFLTRTAKLSASQFVGLRLKLLHLRGSNMPRFTSSHRLVRRLNFESLEDRRVLATFTVTNLNDGPVSAPGTAPGTLRQAIYDANHTAGADVIQFDAGLSGTINLSIVDDTSIGFSALLVSSPITIQGNAAGITIARSTTAAEMRLFHVTSTGDLTLKSTSVTGGIVRGANGVTVGDAGGEGRGGAIYNEGHLSIVASTIYGNMGFGGNGGMFGGAGSGRGGAIYSDGGTVTVTDATLSGNVVQSGTGSKGTSSFGGTIYIRNGSLGIYNSTLTNNTASTGRGVYILAQNGSASADIWSSIIAQNDAPIQARDFLPAIDVGGTLTVTGGNNLIRTQGDYQFITVSTDDPLLAPLANNGGPTMTHALLTGSPAINLGSNPQSLAADQRGGVYVRVAGGTADIGAFESQAVSGPSLLGDYNQSHRVDASDYVLWRNSLGSSVVAYSGADGSGNGTVDAADYAVWKANFGAVGASGTLSSQVGDAAAVAPKESTRAVSGFVAANSIVRQDSKPIKSESQFSDDEADLAILSLNLSSPTASSTYATAIVLGASESNLSDGNSNDIQLDDAIWTEWQTVNGYTAK
jgi:hypothetical protein